MFFFLEISQRPITDNWVSGIVPNFPGENMKLSSYKISGTLFLFYVSWYPGEVSWAVQSWLPSHFTLRSRLKKWPKEMLLPPKEKHKFGEMASWTFIDSKWGGGWDPHASHCTERQHPSNRLIFPTVLYCQGSKSHIYLPRSWSLWV